MIEPTAEPVMLLDFTLRQALHDFDAEGNYRWPFALLNRNAWIFEEQVLLNEISDRDFPMASALGIVPLSEDEAARVLSLARREVELLDPVRARARVEGAEVARRRAAPPPTTIRTGVMHMRKAPAYTYCMELEGAERRAFKIGWAFDFKVRERHFNQAALPDIGGLNYQTRFYHLWDTAQEAFAMEQSLLKHFDGNRHPANREVVFDVAYADVERAWIDKLTRRRERTGRRFGIYPVPGPPVFDATP